MKAITVKNIKFNYPQTSKIAVDDVSFEIEKGSYTAIVGFNGSGKSTIARIICGLESAQEGSVEIAENLTLGMVFQSPKNQLVSGIVNRDTAFGPQNLKLSKGEIELRTIESLNVVQMLYKANSSTSELSLGQTQKVALSGMIAIRPDILILDEAVSMLDPFSRKTISDFLNYWHLLGNTIVQITHDLEVVQEAEHVIGMDNGKKFFDGTKDEFLSDENNVFRITGKALPKTDKSILKEKEKTVTLQVRNLNFNYSEQPTLKNISFDLYKGTITALTGPSGSGKSTILELCSGLLASQQEKSICAVSKPVLAQQNANSALFEAFAADDVAYGPKNKGIKGKELKRVVKDSMNIVSLPFEEFAERKTFSLSGGEQRRLSIAGILAMDTDIVFFDEPTAGLDSKARNAVMQMLRTLADSGKTVLFSTHKMDEADFADREIKIFEGRIIADTCPSENQNVQLNEVLPYDSQSLLSGLRKSQSFLSISSTTKKSLIRKFPPVIKLILFLALFIGTMCIKTIPVCSVGFIVTLLYAHFSGFNFKKLLGMFLKILPFLVFFSVLQLVFHPALPDEVRFTTWKWFMITPSKLLFCVECLLRSFGAIAVFCGFLVSTPEYDLIDGFKVLLKPFELIKIPVRYFILILEIIFRFIPLLIEEASGIIKTQLIRGGLGKTKGAMAKIKGVIPLIVPMIIQTIKRSEALADAITMRCFK